MVEPNCRNFKPKKCKNNRGPRHRQARIQRMLEWKKRGQRQHPGYSTGPETDSEANQPCLFHPLLPVESSPRFFLRTELGILNTAELVAKERELTQTALEALEAKRAMPPPLLKEGELAACESQIRHLQNRLARLPKPPAIPQPATAVAAQASTLSIEEVFLEINSPNYKNFLMEEFREFHVAE